MMFNGEIYFVVFWPIYQNVEWHRFILEKKHFIILNDAASPQKKTMGRTVHRMTQRNENDILHPME